ncbi:MAG: AbrB family looped-hinge helix DNA binding protein [Patiriisocius sp.]|jgi:AbrB family looped-hinge helix DNA binding protein
MQTIKLQQRGILTLPKKLRDALDLFEGQSLNVQEENGKIVIEPEKSFDAQLASDLKQGLEDIKNGNFIEFSSSEELHKKLKTYNAD